MILSTWFYSSPENEKFHYPSVGLDSDSESFQLCYFKCIIGFFTSAFFHNHAEIMSGELKLVLLCNRLPDYVSKILFTESLRELNVDILFFQPSKIPNFSYEQKLLFGSVFAEIDVIEVLCNKYDKDEFAFILDNDILINKNLKHIMTDYKSTDILVLKMQSDDPNENIQGLKQSTLHEISDSIKLSIPIKRSYTHTGGEIVAMNIHNLKIFFDLCNSTYTQNLILYSNHKNYFMTEEQIFSSVYRYFQDVVFCNFIQRIWTEIQKYRTVNGRESELTFLHMPAEKRNGFGILHQSIQEFRASEGSLVSIHQSKLFEFSNIKNIFKL